MLKTRRAQDNPDGSPYFEFTLTQEELDAGLHAFMTGPIAGTFAMLDGTVYDVTDFAIPVKVKHVGELHIAIHKAHHAAGRFTDVPLPELAAVEL